MALSDIVHRVRTILYGQSLGESPPIRLGAASAAESTSGQLVTFALASGQGTKVKAGDVLSVYDPETEADAHVIYVTSVATDTITGVNGWLGSPLVVGADSGDLDGAVFEHNALATGYEIFQAIDTIVDRYLWPDVYTLETKTVAAPDLIDGQEAITTDVMEIIHAWQRIGPTNYPIPFQRTPLDVDTTLASTGRMAEFDWIDGSTGYFTCKTKIVEADEATSEITHLIAVGAAALLLGASVIEATLADTKQTNKEAVSQRSSAGGILWRDFLTLKQEFSRELGRRIPQRVVIDRG